MTTNINPNTNSINCNLTTNDGNVVETATAVFRAQKCLQNAWGQGIEDGMKCLSLTGGINKTTKRWMIDPGKGSIFIQTGIGENSFISVWEQSCKKYGVTEEFNPVRRFIKSDRIARRNYAEYLF